MTKHRSVTYWQGSALRCLQSFGCTFIYLPTWAFSRPAIIFSICNWSHKWLIWLNNFLFSICFRNISMSAILFCTSCRCDYECCPVLGSDLTANWTAFICRTVHLYESISLGFFSSPSLYFLWKLRIECPNLFWSIFLYYQVWMCSPLCFPFHTSS